MTVVPSIVETQANLEVLFHKHQLIPVLREQFKPVLEKLNLDYDPMKVDVLVQIYLHKQADLPTMVGLFSPKWGSPQEVADLLYECVEDDLMDFDMETKKFILNYSVSTEVQDLLDMYQYPLPMVVPPKRITNNNMGSGYITEKGRIVLNGTSVIDDEDLCLDHINRANNVKLTLNVDVIASPEGNRIKPVRRAGESYPEFEQREKQSKTFYETSVDVMQGMLTLGNEFYLTHKYDRRGRCYAMGYHINSQGTDYNKAVLELARKEKLT